MKIKTNKQLNISFFILGFIFGFLFFLMLGGLLFILMLGGLLFILMLGGMQVQIPDYSQTPCKSIVVENIHNVEKGKELTAPLAYLNRSCEFKRVWDKLGPIEQSEMKSYKKAVYMKAYRQRPKVKAQQKVYQKAYYQRQKGKVTKC